LWPLILIWWFLYLFSYSLCFNSFKDFSRNYYLIRLVCLNPFMLANVKGLWRWVLLRCSLLFLCLTFLIMCIHAICLRRRCVLLYQYGLDKCCLKTTMDMLSFSLWLIILKHHRFVLTFRAALTKSGFKLRLLASSCCAMWQDIQLQFNGFCLLNLIIDLDFCPISLVTKVNLQFLIQQPFILIKIRMLLPYELLHKVRKELILFPQLLYFWYRFQFSCPVFISLLNVIEVLKLIFDLHVQLDDLLEI